MKNGKNLLVRKKGDGSSLLVSHKRRKLRNKILRKNSDPNQRIPAIVDRMNLIGKHQCTLPLLQYLFTFVDRNPGISAQGVDPLEIFVKMRHPKVLPVRIGVIIAVAVRIMTLINQSNPPKR